MLGTLGIDTRPFSAEVFSMEGTAEIAQKPVIGARPPAEFTGDGGEVITISGQLLPSKIGGLTELETLHEMRRKGARFPVMRGDGARLGTLAITSISEAHKDLLRDGIGFVIAHEIKLLRVQGGKGSGQQTIKGLLSLFDGL